MNLRTHSPEVKRKRENTTFQFRLPVALLTALALAGGCNLAPNYKTPPVPIPGAFKETDGWKTAQPKDDALRGKWWEVFGDPQLNTYEEQVCISNQNVAAGFANFLAARAVVKEARSQYFPTVSANPSVVRSHSSSSIVNSSSPNSSSIGSGRSGTGTLYSLPLDASWEPDLWGAIRNTVKANTSTAQASAATLANLRLTAEAELAVDYYELRGQDALGKVLTDIGGRRSGNHWSLTKALYETGIDSDEDVAAAETQLATAQAQAANLGIQRAQYEHAIALLLGRPASTFSIAAHPFSACGSGASFGRNTVTIARAAAGHCRRRARGGRGQRADRRGAGGVFPNAHAERSRGIRKHIAGEFGFGAKFCVVAGRPGGPNHF